MVDVKKGDLVTLEYTGRLLSTGKVIDTTSEKVAKEAGIWESGAKYGPKQAIFGSGSIMPGIENAILQAKLGVEEDFIIEPEDAFGRRNSSLVRMVAERDFLRQNIVPTPGLVVALDNRLARVKSVTSGRVVVDFNHPFAGERLVYSLKVNEVISDSRKKIEALLSANSLEGKILQEDGKTAVILRGATPQKAEAMKLLLSLAAPEAEVKVEGG